MPTRTRTSIASEAVLVFEGSLLVPRPKFKQQNPPCRQDIPDKRQSLRHRLAVVTARIPTQEESVDEVPTNMLDSNLPSTQPDSQYQTAGQSTDIQL